MQKMADFIFDCITNIQCTEIEHLFYHPDFAFMKKNLFKSISEGKGFKSAILTYCALDGQIESGLLLNELQFQFLQQTANFNVPRN